MSSIKAVYVSTPSEIRVEEHVRGDGVVLFTQAGRLSFYRAQAEALADQILTIVTAQDDAETERLREA